MLAKFAGKCDRCLGVVNVGDSITWNRKRRGIVYHVNCSKPVGSFKTYEEKVSTDISEFSIQQLRDTLNGTEDKTEMMTPTIEEQDITVMHPITPVKPTKPANGDLAAMLANAISGYLPDQTAKLDENAVREIVQNELSSIGALPTRVELKTSPEAEVKDLGVQHKQFPLLLQVISAGVNVWITGPAGSGKTTAADNVASALGKQFYFCGAQSNEYGLLGFKTATGELVRTPFREAFENGGVFLFDEVDASAPSAVLAFNAALANGFCAFPDGMVKKHADFIAIAAANTFGLGGTNDYVGRMKQDAAFIDRFVFLSWEYDEALETATAGNKAWSKRVQAVRANVKRLGIKLIISPRASYYGAKLIAAGVDMESVETLTLKKGMDATQWESVR